MAENTNNKPAAAKSASVSIIGIDTFADKPVTLFMGTTLSGVETKAIEKAVARNSLKIKLVTEGFKKA